MMPELWALKRGWLAPLIIKLVLPLRTLSRATAALVLHQNGGNVIISPHLSHVVN